MAKSRFKKLKKLIKKNPDDFKTQVDVAWFIKWLKTHMDVYNDFAVLAHELRARRPGKVYSARLIIEKMRWDFIMKYDDANDETYRINGDATPYISRLVMLEFPKLSGMFKTRIKIKPRKTKGYIYRDDDGIYHPKGR